MYIKNVNSTDDQGTVTQVTLIEYKGLSIGRPLMLEAGWTYYDNPGNLPVSRLSLDDTTGEVTVLPEVPVVSTEEWVDKALFVNAFVSLLDDTTREVMASDWRVMAAIAQLPGDRVNLLDPRVPTFLGLVNMTVDQVKAKMEYLSGNILEDLYFPDTSESSSSEVQ